MAWRWPYSSVSPAHQPAGAKKRDLYLVVVTIAMVSVGVGAWAGDGVGRCRSVSVHGHVIRLPSALPASQGAAVTAVHLEPTPAYPHAHANPVPPRHNWTGCQPSTIIRLLKHAFPLSPPLPDHRSHAFVRDHAAPGRGRRAVGRVGARGPTRRSCRGRRCRRGRGRCPEVGCRGRWWWWWWW